MINKIKIKITGKNPNYFLNELIKRNINIYHLEKDNKNLILIINYKDYINIIKIKTTYKIKILKRYGISRIKELIKRYLYYIIFFFIGIILNIILSNIIFKVEIIHPKKEIINLVEKNLQELGIKKYSFKKNKKELKRIKEKILMKERNRIEWIEIEPVGTKYIVKLEERKLNKKEEICNPRNIVSKKEAIILEIKSESGEIVKKINDLVSPDEVIISGLIHNKDNIVSKRCAKGIIYGETWYKVKLTIPKTYVIEKLSNKISYGININIFNNNLDINNKYKNFRRKSINDINSNIIPINISLTKYLETKIISKIYTIDNVDEIALKLSEKEINKKIRKDESILSKKVLKKNIKNSKIEIEVFLKVKEDITKYQDISNINVEDLNKKEE